MNKFIYIFIILLGCIACEEEKVPFYSDRDRINFVGTDQYDEDDPDEMYTEMNFIDKQKDTTYFTLEVKLQGEFSDDDREVYFTQRDSTSPGVELVLNKCVIPAGKERGSCQIGIVRPKEGDVDFVSFICFDYERSDFERGTMERQKFMVKTYDRIPSDSGIDDYTWNNYGMLKEALGRWSETKARFICRTLGIDDFFDWCYSSGRWDRYSYPPVCHDKGILEEALETYQSSPSNPPLYDETLLPEKVWIDFVVE